MAAKTQEDLQKMAMAANGHRQAKKISASFGIANANCYADGGYVKRSVNYGVKPGPQVFKADGGYIHRTKRYDQTGSPCGMADGGMIAAVKGMQGKRDAAIEAAVNGPA